MLAPFSGPRKNTSNSGVRIFLNHTPSPSNYYNPWYRRYTSVANQDQSGGQTSRQSPLPEKWTQHDQDNADDEERQKAMDALLQSWKEKLSWVSLISTFFAATEAQLLSTTTPSDPTNVSTIDQAANAGLSGALIMHIFAAIISFLAAFVLIRYELCEASSKQELKVEHAAVVPLSNTPSAGSSSSSTPPVFTTDPHLEHQGPFGASHPPMHFLRKCNSLCVWLSIVGTILALMGFICFTWSQMPTSVSVFSSACVGGCLIAGVIAVL